MVAPARRRCVPKIQTIINARDNSARLIGQRALKARAIDKADTRCCARCRFAVNRAPVRNRPRKQTRCRPVKHARYPCALKTQTITSRARTRSALAPALNCTGIDYIKRVTRFGKLHREARAFIACARINRAAIGIIQGKVLRRTIGINRTIALITRADNRTGVVNNKARTVNVQRPAVGTDRPRIHNNTARMVSFAKIKPVIDP